MKNEPKTPSAAQLRRVLETIRDHATDNWEKRGVLLHLSGLSSDSVFRLCVQMLVTHHGEPIATNPAYGYRYLVGNVDALLASARTLRTKASSLFERAAAMEETAARMVAGMRRQGEFELDQEAATG